MNLCCTAHKEIDTCICKQGIKKEESIQLLVKGTVNVSTLLKNAEIIMQLIATPLKQQTALTVKLLLNFSQNILVIVKNNYNNSLLFSPV